MNKVCLGLLVSLVASNLFAAPVVVLAPDGQVSASFEVKDGTLFYSISKEGNPIVDSSKVEVFAGAKMSVAGHTVKKNDSTWKTAWGQFSEIRDHHNELTLNLKAGDNPVQLLCRVFDDGLGFRYILPAGAPNPAFSCEYNLSSDVQVYCRNGEREPVGPVAVEELGRIQLPVLAERADGRFIALLETDLYSAAGFESLEMAVEQGVLVGTNKAAVVAKERVTPWRLILLGENPGDLLESQVAVNLAAPCQLDDPVWVKPGKGLWDWRIHGYDNGDFVYGINTPSYLRLIDFCAEQGIEYLTIDDHWYKKIKNKEKTKVSMVPRVDIEKVMNHAEQKGVQIILYYDRRYGNFGDKKLFPYYASLGAGGMKYGFMNNNAGFTRGAILAASQRKMLINFHDNPCPMTGVQRTLPNLITRETCHAQQDSRKAFTPRSFLKMAMINALLGPLDMANGNFGLAGINAGGREKGPREKNSYVSTVTSEIARTLVIFSGLITLPDAPEEYLKKPDLFEFLKQMPATWDETRIVNCKLPEYITTARRTGDTWFVGSVNDETPRTLAVKLNFLDVGKTYEATIYQDAEESHGVHNPEAYEIRTMTVRRGDVIQAIMALGGGHAMIIRPKK